METKQYIPINCSFHDQLLELATLRKPVKILYSHKNEIHTIYDVIVDVYTAKTKEEFLKLASGVEIRLDQIIKAENYAAPDNQVC